MRLVRSLALGTLLLAPAAARAQKKVLTQADWDKWKSIQGAAISNDGKWALYTLVPLVGDGEMIVRATEGVSEYHVPRGYLGRPNNVPGGLRPRATGNPEDDPNTASAYGGIRWGTGISRSGQYENGQSRIGGSIWESPLRYIENSPLFWLDKVTTPLFIMNNDADDAVPWYQGIETFVGMRRLGKEVYFIDYNNDVHNPASRANQKDIAMRMQQFFDNKLKGVPAPDWMVHGIPYRDKGRDQLPGVPAQP